MLKKLWKRQSPQSSSSDQVETNNTKNKTADSCCNKMASSTTATNNGTTKDAGQTYANLSGGNCSTCSQCTHHQGSAGKALTDSSQFQSDHKSQSSGYGSTTGSIASIASSTTNNAQQQQQQQALRSLPAIPTWTSAGVGAKFMTAPPFWGDQPERGGAPWQFPQAVLLFPNAAMLDQSTGMQHSSLPVGTTDSTGMIPSLTPTAKTNGHEHHHEHHHHAMHRPYASFPLSAPEKRKMNDDAAIQGVNEHFNISLPVKPGRKRTVPEEALSSDAKVKLERKRELNKEAARKCREKKIKRINQLEEEVDKLKALNDALRRQLISGGQDNVPPEYMLMNLKPETNGHDDHSPDSSSNSSGSLDDSEVTEKNEKTEKVDERDASDWSPKPKRFEDQGAQLISALDLPQTRK